MLKKYTTDIIKTSWYRSPCGDLLLGSYGGRLCLCDWECSEDRDFIVRRLCKRLSATVEQGDSEVTEMARRQLDEYFSARRQVFDVPLLFVGTDFQKSAWRHLLTIPYSATLSYGEMARQMGVPRAVRAVAAANHANAISIFAPCHRVIGSDGRLVGYGGGLTAKRFLLELEAKRVAQCERQTE